MGKDKKDTKKTKVKKPVVVDEAKDKERLEFSRS